MKPSQIVEAFGGKTKKNEGQLKQLKAEHAALVRERDKIEARMASDARERDKIQAKLEKAWMKMNAMEPETPSGKEAKPGVEIGVNCCKDPATHSYISNGVYYSECENCGKYTKSKA